jgi:hypothetical protein
MVCCIKSVLSLVLLLMFSALVSGQVDTAKELLKCERENSVPCYCALAERLNDTRICGYIPEGSYAGKYARDDCMAWVSGNKLIDGPCWGSSMSICGVLANVRRMCVLFLAIPAALGLLATLVQWLIKRKTTAQTKKAAMILIGFFVVAFALTYMLFRLFAGDACSLTY